MHATSSYSREEPYFAGEADQWLEQAPLIVPQVHKPVQKPEPKPVIPQTEAQVDDTDALFSFMEKLKPSDTGLLSRDELDFSGSQTLLKSILGEEPSTSAA